MMPAISLRNFNGMVPRADERALTPGMASAAVNCKLWNSQLRPWAGLVEHAVLGKAGEIKTLYRAFKSAGDDGSGFFFHWPDAVDVARGHINLDPNERTYFTGDGKPQMTDATIATGGGGDEYPTNSYDLGIPVPASGMYVTIGQDVTKTHSYSMAYVEEYPAGSGIFYEGGKTTRDVSVVRQPRNKVTLSNIPVYKKTTRKIRSKRIYRATEVTATVAAMTVDGSIVKIELDTVHGLEAGASVTIAGCDQSAYNKTYGSITLVAGEEDSFTVPKPSGAPGTITGDNITCTYEYPARFMAEISNDIDKWTDDILSDNPDPETTVNVASWSIDTAADRVTFVLADDADLEVGMVVLVQGATQSAYNVSVEVAETFGPADLKTFVFDQPAGAGDTLTTGGTITVRYASGHGIYKDRGGKSIPVPGAKFMKAENLEAYDPEDIESRSYVVTFVSEWSSITEEGHPSAPTVAVDVAPGDAVTVKGIPVASGDVVITSKNIYRTATDGNSTGYYLVGSVGPTATEFVDDVLTEDLGEVLASDGNYPPPADMHSLIAMPNGMMMGASGKLLCPGKAYMPHAYDPLNQVAFPHPIVALGFFDNTAVVLTQENPHLVTGASPEYLSETQLRLGQGCVAKRSVVSGPGGVIYASPDGLMQIGPSGPRLLTAQYFTRDEWRALNPSSMHGCLFENRYFCFYKASDTDRGGFILDPNDPEAGLTFLNFYATATYPDALADYLFMVLDDAGTNKVYRFDADSTSPLRYVWRSASFLLSQPATFQAARLIADSYRDITFRLYYRSERESWRLWHQQLVRSKQPFRMPGGAAWREWQIEIEGSDAVSGVDIAQCISELAGA